MESTLAQRITEAGNTRRANEATTLSDFYAARGQSLPSIAERQALARSAGITGYSGTATQNRQLLSYLQQNPLTPNGINLATVPEEVDLVPEFTPVLPEVPTPTLTPIAPSQVPLAPRDQLGSNIDAITAEIQTIEQRMAGREAERAAGYDSAGVWEDMRRLNELNASLREAQDRQIEIPLEARQQLRGRGATFTEAGQITAPQLEQAALQELTLSRQAGRLSESIQLNMAQVDQYINAEKERDALLYQQKNNYLSTLQTAYGNIITAEQNLALEEAKHRNAMELKGLDANRNYLDQMAKIAIEAGDFAGAQRILASGNVDDAFAINQERVSGQQMETALTVIDDIDRLLEMPGLRNAVGPNWALRQIGRGLAPLGSINDFLAALDGFTAQETLNKLVAVKAEGATFGALSDRERLMLDQAAVQIRRTGDGSGPVQMTQKAFKEVMNTIRTASQKTFLAANGYQGSVLREMDSAAVDSLFSSLRAQQAQETTQQQYFPSAQADQTISSTIRQFEGFSSTAYPDAGGWAIGYGSQTHPDGRPVRPGDTITPSQAEQYLASAINKHSNWKSSVTRQLSPAQQAALASFEFNLGPAIWRTDETAGQILARVNAGDFNGAGQLMQRFIYSQGQPHPALQNRRLAEAQLLNTFS